MAKDAGETKEEQEKNKKDISGNKENGSCHGALKTEEQRLPKFMNGLRKGKYKEEQINEFLEEYQNMYLPAMINPSIIKTSQDIINVSLWKFLGFLSEEEYLGWKDRGEDLKEILKKRKISKKPWEKEGYDPNENVRKQLKRGREAARKLKEKSRNIEKRGNEQEQNDWVKGWTKAIENL